MDPLIYKEIDPVNEARAVVLHKGQFDDQIVCHLEPFAVSSPPGYEALSYVWGDKSKTKTIILAGQNFEVTLNLEAALRHLRQLDSDRILWIDAICIDQKNYKERGHQVGQMGRIYQRAQSVRVWLGPSQDRSDEAMDLIRRMCEEKDPSWSLEDEPNRNLRALSFLMDRRWFRRRWVAQEIAFAAIASVQCGHYTIDWNQLANAINILQTRQADIDKKIDRLVDWRFGRSEAGRYGDIRAWKSANFLVISQELLCKDKSNQIMSYRADIDALVCTVSDLSVSDPRDFVYSLVSLANDTKNEENLVPDYIKSSLEVCIDLTRHVVYSKKSLDLICSPWSPQIVGLPSWIRPRVWPRYLISAAGEEFRTCGKTFARPGGISFYNASKQSLASAEIFETSGLGPVLQTRGFVVDIINQVGDCAPHGNLLLPQICITFGPPKLLSQVIIGGKTLSGMGSPELYVRMCNVLFGPNGQNTLRYMFGGIGTYLIRMPELLYNIMDDSLYTESEVLEYVQRVEDCVFGRRLVKTSGDRLGLAPKESQENDLIVILLGCSVPVVLRPSGDYYTLIGEAYIHGIMDGEAMDDHDKETDAFQYFDLK